MQIPANVFDFHNIELVEFSDDCLAKPFYLQWTDFDNSPIAYSECIGYKIPLFLGGDDTLENLERTNLDVYLDLYVFKCGIEIKV